MYHVCKHWATIALLFINRGILCAEKNLGSLLRSERLLEHVNRGYDKLIERAKTKL